jgi:hypothetical protein
VPFKSPNKPVPLPPRPSHRASVAVLAVLTGAAGAADEPPPPPLVPVPGQAQQAFDASSERWSLAERVAAVRAAWAELPSDGPTQQAANWTNWPKWSKWSNWANK